MWEAGWWEVEGRNSSVHGRPNTTCLVPPVLNSPLTKSHAGKAGVLCGEFEQQLSE